MIHTADELISGGAQCPCDGCAGRVESATAQVVVAASSPRRTRLGAFYERLLQEKRQTRDAHGRFVKVPAPLVRWHPAPWYLKMLGHKGMDLLHCPVKTPHSPSVFQYMLDYHRHYTEVHVEAPKAEVYRGGASVSDIVKVGEALHKTGISIKGDK